MVVAVVQVQQALIAGSGDNGGAWRCWEQLAFEAVTTTLAVVEEHLIKEDRQVLEVLVALVEALLW